MRRHDAVFEPGYSRPRMPTAEVLWCAWRDQELLLSSAGDEPALPVGPPSSLPAPPLRPPHYLGRLGKMECWAVDLPVDCHAAEGTWFASLRPIFGHLPEQAWALAGRALQVLHWERDSIHCGRCAAFLQPAAEERMRLCPDCGFHSYPIAAPAVIVAVVRDDRILLGNSVRFPGRFYSVLAGFVEPGETLEETAAREVAEESGIVIKDIEYFGSQPWPPGASLMVGFTAQYASGEIRIQESEMHDVAWFKKDTMPPIPPPGSIAGQLINWFLEGRRR